MLTQKELNNMICSIPDCQHSHDRLYLHGACHVKSDVQASYSKDKGTVDIVCATCKKPIAEIAVAKGPVIPRSLDE